MLLEGDVLQRINAALEVDVLIGHFEQDGDPGEVTLQEEFQATQIHHHHNSGAKWLPISELL